jgi:hypothetical protein
MLFLRKFLAFDIFDILPYLNMDFYPTSSDTNTDPDSNTVEIQVGYLCARVVEPEGFILDPDI